MSAQPEALRLANELERWLLVSAPTRLEATAELRRLHAQMAACEPYLKEGETPAERIERDHRDSLALMTLLAREKTKNEALLEALQMLLEFPNTGPATSAARAAIAKAEGRS